MYSIFNVTIDSSDAEKKLGRLENDIMNFENLITNCCKIRTQFIKGMVRI